MFLLCIFIGNERSSVTLNNANFVLYCRHLLRLSTDNCGRVDSNDESLRLPGQKSRIVIVASCAFHIPK